MKLIVGLGNPGKQYDNTPHNIGFHVLDILAQRTNAQWAVERRFDAMIAEVRIWDRKTTLMKPLTYMNLSGKAVSAWKSKNGGEPHEMLVISDDINLPLGRLRFRANGSHGGQKGLLSVINSLGTLEFPRLRIGVRPASDHAVADVSSYVLGHVRPADREVFEGSCEDAADAIEMIFKKDLLTAMNHYNRKT